MRTSDWSSDVCSSDLIVVRANPYDLPQLWQQMNAALRNLGRPGLGLMAIAAVDIALWDIKARLLGISLARLFGRARESVPVYGSGGFTNYDAAQLKTQLGGWVRDGICAVKITIGSDPHDDPRRVKSEEPTSELPSLMRHSYAVFFLTNTTCTS